MTTRAVVACSGRDHDDAGNSIGERCPATVKGQTGSHAWRCAEDLMSMTWHTWPAEPLSEVQARARAGGWAIAPDGTAMCPRCRRTDPRITKALREMGRTA